MPTIDLSAWSEPPSPGETTPSGRERVAAEFDDGCSRLGFLQVAGHGVDPGLIEGMLAAADAIFALPPAAKAALVPPPHLNRGYAPMGSESLTYSLGLDAPPDLFEAFNIGPDHVPSDDPVYRQQLDGVFAPNWWPEGLIAERHALVDYFEAVAALAHRLTGVAAVALGLAEDHFVDKTDHSTDTLRLNNYVRVDGAAGLAPGQLRMGAHTDYGILTILYGDRVPGLEIVGPDGGWHSVVPDPGVFLVNLGDLLAQWTNDRWRSTVHRVVPPVGSGPQRRRSAAFFHDGNHDAWVECLPTCLAPGEQPRYPPVVAGEHLAAKVRSARARDLEATPTSRQTVGERLGAVTDSLAD